MKKLFLSLIFTLPTAAVVPAQAQYQGPACVDIRQVNVPGGYDDYGNYYPPTTRAVQTTVPCNYGISNQYYYNQRQYQPYYQRACNPNAGAAIGAGLAGALSGGTGYNYNSNYSNNYSRNSSSGSYSSSYRNNNSWALFGAGLGSIIFSC